MFRMDPERSVALLRVTGMMHYREALELPLDPRVTLAAHLNLTALLLRGGDRDGALVHAGRIGLAGRGRQLQFVDILEGIETFMEKEGIRDIKEITGAALTNR